MYKNKCIIQIGAHVGNTSNDPIYKHEKINNNFII